MNSKTKKQKNNLIRYASSNVGFAISIPPTWLEVKKTSYRDLGVDSNTLFAFAADKFTIVTAIFTGFCKKRNFNKFFDKVNFSEDYKVLKRGQKEYSNVSSKFVIIEKDDKKIVNNFCLINEMIVNFTINIDPKTKIVNAQSLVMDKNFKLINDIIKNIEIFKPINPPVLVNDDIMKNEITDEEQNNLAKQLIENDCKYKNILIPDFYLKYVYEKNHCEEILTVVNEETYFKGMKDPFRIIKNDENLVEEISTICKNNILNLSKMNTTDDKNMSNSKIILKLEEQYIYIDLFNEQTNLDVINMMLNNIIDVIKNYTNYKIKKICVERNIILVQNKEEKEVIKSSDVHQNCDCELCKEERKIIESISKELDEFEEGTKIEISPEIKEKINQINHEIEKLKYEKAQASKVVKEDEIGEEAETILNELDKEIENLNNLKDKVVKENVELPENIEDSGESILTKLTAEIEKTHNIRKTKKEKIEQINHEIEKLKYEKAQASKVVKEDEIGEEAETILNELDKEIENLNNLKDKVVKENVELPENIEDSGESILTKLSEIIESTIKERNNIKSSNDQVTNGLEEELKEINRDVQSEIVIPIVIDNNDDSEASESDEIKEEKEKFENVNNEKVNFDLTTFDEYYHNIDGHASFKFLFPHNSGEKVLRDFNVFDIVREDVEYRIFIFKCENKEKYILKLDNWMTMNKTSNKCEIKEQYNKTTEKGLEIKTFVFENGKFYKSIYKNDYLLAVSGMVTEEKLNITDLALETAEVGEDNRMLVESQERKMRSIQILQSQNIPYIDELPAIKSSYEIQGKNLEEIAKRAMVLCVCCNFASDILSNKKRRYLKESKKFFNKMIDKYFLRDSLTRDEKRLLDKMDKDLAIQMSWQFEGYAVLLWTLGLLDEIPFPDTLVDPDSVTEIVSSCETYREFLEKCNLRTVEEVLDLADLTYRYNWYCVDSKILNEETILNSEIVMERHRAFNWLLTNQQWDKVEINT